MSAEEQWDLVDAGSPSPQPTTAATEATAEAATAADNGGTADAGAEAGAALDVEKQAPQPPSRAAELDDHEPLFGSHEADPEAAFGDHNDADTAGAGLLGQGAGAGAGSGTASAAAASSSGISGDGGWWDRIKQDQGFMKYLLVILVVFGFAIFLGVAAAEVISSHHKSMHNDGDGVTYQWGTYCAAPQYQGAANYAARAACLHKNYIMIDGHNDLPWEYREHGNDAMSTLDLRREQATVMTDLPKLKAGGVGGQFWSVYVPCSMQHVDAVRATLEQIDVVYNMANKYSDSLEVTTTAQGARNAHARGKVASFIGVEGGHSIDSSLGALRMLYQLGARYMTLTHTCNTPWADSSVGPTQHGGINKFGNSVVREMNRLGMLVDLSHVSVDTMNNVLDIAEAPVMFSHSSARALCDHPRNVPDYVLNRLKDNGGVVMVNFYPDFVSCSSTATLSQVADHVDHIVKVAGIDHVGYGSDFDGIPRTPAGLENPSDFPALTAELLARGYTEEQLIKILGGNILRAMEQAEKVAARMQQTVAPLDQVIFPAAQCRSDF